MKIDLQASLINWRDNTSDRVKLQNVYLALAVASILVAGLVGLINYDIGQQLVTVGLVSLGLFLVNTVAWALIEGLVLVRLSRQATTKKKVAPTTKKSIAKK